MASAVAPTTVVARPAEAPYLIRSEALSRRLDEGRDLLYALELTEAERLFTQMASQPEGRLAAWHHLSIAALLRAVISDREADLRAAAHRSDSLDALAARMPAGTWTSFVRADLALHRMVALGLGDRSMAAALAARSAYGRYGALVRAAPDFHEAYAGMGMLHLAIGSLPRGYRSILKLLGYSGTVEGGLAELRVAATRSRYNRETATIAAALTDALLFNEPERSLPPLRALRDARPESPLFSYLYGYLLFRCRRGPETASVLGEVVKWQASPGRVWMPFAEHYLARTYYQLDRYAEAEGHFRRFLARHQGKSMRAVSTLGIGLSLEMQGKRAEAVRYYRQVQQLRDLDSDDAAFREAQRRLAHPMTDRERRLMLARNAYDSGRYPLALQLLDRIAHETGLSADEQAEAAYRMGRVLQAEGRPDEALRWYLQAAAVAPPNGMRWGPWSRYYAGTLYAASGRKEQAREAFQAVLRHRGKYDYQQALEQSTKAALARL